MRNIIPHLRRVQRLIVVKSSYASLLQFCGSRHEIAGPKRNLLLKANQWPELHLSVPLPPKSHWADGVRQRWMSAHAIGCVTREEYYIWEMRFYRKWKRACTLEKHYLSSEDLSPQTTLKNDLDKKQSIPCVFGMPCKNLQGHSGLWQSVTPNNMLGSWDGGGRWVNSDTRLEERHRGGNDV